MRNKTSLAVVSPIQIQKRREVIDKEFDKSDTLLCKMDELLSRYSMFAVDIACKSIIRTIKAYETLYPNRPPATKYSKIPKRRRLDKGF